MFYKILFICLINSIFNAIAVPINFDSFGEYLQETENSLEDDSRTGITKTTYRWPNQALFYEIEATIDSNHTTRILNAMKAIENSTCIRFYPRKKYTYDYIFITGKPTGCHSPVGRRGGKQILNLELQSRCFKEATICHEFIHALGFFHQQNDPDRDSYVKIIEKNIIPSKVFAFKKQTKSSVTDFGVGYDYDSVMHYGEYAFSANGEKTIVPFNETAIIGQTIGLSKKDILKINIMYNCKNYL